MRLRKSRIISPGRNRARRGRLSRVGGRLALVQRGDGGDKRLAARFIIAELVETRAGGGQQHNVARLRHSRGTADSGGQHFAVIDRHVILQQLGIFMPSLADGVGGLDVGIIGHALVQMIGLGEAADDPVDARLAIDRRPCAQRRGGGRGVGRLAVVDPQHAITLRHPLHPVRQRGVGAQGLLDRGAIYAQRLRNGARHRDILRVVRSLQRGPARLIGGGYIGGMHARHPRHTSGNRLRICIIQRYDRRMPRCLHFKHARLGRAIAIETIVTIQMIRCDVEQHRHVAIEAVGEVDLIARQLQHIDAARWQRLLPQYRQADIAAPCERGCPPSR